MKNYFLLPLFLFYCACSPSDSYLEKAGSNRPEITKVLDYYTNVCPDSLKLAAAVFLFTHMDGHYELSNDNYKKYVLQLDSLSLNSVERQLAKIIPVQYPFRQIGLLERRDDLEQISSSYLINHIDYVFGLWRNEPWLQDVNFDDICEFLLPYRITNESLIDWEKSAAQLKKQAFPLLCTYDDMKYSINNLTKDFWRSAYVSSDYNSSRTDMKLPLIGNYRLECQDHALQNLLYYRMLGIPAAMDYVPYWGNMEDRHYWATPVAREMKTHTPLFDVTRRAGKVLRKTYSKHPTFSRLEDEYFSPQLADSFSIDVTDEYMACYDLKVKFLRTPKHQYKYLTVFNNLAWRPMGMSRNAAFLKMGGNLVYLPVCLDVDGEAQPLAYPFILDGKGAMKSLKPDTTRLQSVRLLRKYPYEFRKATYNTYAEGTLFIASNRKDFVDADTLFSITNNIGMAAHEIGCRPGNNYRYLKIVPRRFISLSQLRFFTDREIRIAGYELLGELSRNASFVFDDNVLSYGDIRDDLVVDLGGEYELKKIMFQGRHDGNNVCPGDAYELLYMSLDGWKSCGKQQAVEASLAFDRVPSNALFLLRNLTKGKEERPFTYQNGMQRFW